LVAHEAPGQVVGMEVGDQILRDAVAVALRGAHDRIDVPGRVHHRRLVRVRVTEQVDVVLHRTELELLEVDGELHGRPPVHSTGRTTVKRGCVRGPTGR